LLVTLLVGVALVALANLTMVSLGRNRSVKDQVVATRLAQEGVEWLKSQRSVWGYDAWVTSLTSNLNQTLCLPESKVIQPVEEPQKDCPVSLESNQFRWMVAIENSDAQYVEIQVFAWGKSMGQSEPVSITTRIYRWER